MPRVLPVIMRLLPAAVLFGAVILRVIDPPILQQVRNLTFDVYQRLSPRDPGGANALVQIVDIDDESLKKLGQWPWPRNVVAAMLDKLYGNGAILAAFDIVFAEPDRLSPRRVLASWPDTPEIIALRDKLKTLPDTDATLAAAMKRGRTIGSFILTHNKSAALPKPPVGFAHAGYDPRPFLFAFTGATTNLPMFEKAFVGYGAVNWLPDHDQVVRSVPILLRVGQHIYPSLSAEVLRVAQGASTYLIRTTAGSGESSFGSKTGITAIKIGNAVIPTDANGRMIIHFAPQNKKRYIPAWKLLAGQVPRARIQNHIFLIGTSAAGLLDLRATPLQAGVPGVEVHAQAIEQVIAGKYLVRPDFSDGIEVLLLVVIGLAIVLLFPRVGAIWGLVVFVPLIAVIFGAGWYAFARFGWEFDSAYPGLAVLLVLLTTTLMTYLMTERQRNRVRSAFGMYLSPDLVERLAEDPSQLKLGGEVREMSILFSDVRGFTGISERFDAAGLTAFMNAYLTSMTEAVLARHGTVDKYIGDAVMAFWNAPLDDAEHARHACACALAMIARLETLNEELEIPKRADEDRPPPLAIGIGINTGQCSVGNFGSRQRFDYSVLGDEVNLASRLEGLCRLYDVAVIVSAHTASHVEDHALIELDRVVVKGKTQAVAIFTILGDPAHAATPGFAELSAAHTAMLDAFRGQDWDGAARALDRCTACGVERLNGLYALYRERIAEYRTSPPGPDWDGVYVATEK
jgi:adenylate cyclase